MKKLVLISLIFFGVQHQLFSQILKGIGVFGALTDSRNRYRNVDAGSRQFTSSDLATNPNYYFSNYIGAEKISWGAGIFAEFSRNDAARWQTEIAYIKKGSKEKDMTDPLTGARDGGFGVNRYTYIQWNNYLKFFNGLGLYSNWYWMIGIRAEFNLINSSPMNSPYSSPGKIWASGDLGAGMEFPLIRKINWFVEEHWNQDIYNLKKNSSVSRRLRCFETRIGLVYRPRRKSIDDCNAPKYRGPAY
jgi:hypothetical protein